MKNKLIFLPIRTTHVELFQVTASISFKCVMNRRYIGQDGCPPCGHDNIQGTVFLITISKSYWGAHEIQHRIIYGFKSGVAKANVERSPGSKELTKRKVWFDAMPAEWVGRLLLNNAAAPKRNFTFSFSRYRLTPSKILVGGICNEERLSIKFRIVLSH